MKVIDLTLPYDERIQGFSMETARTKAKDGWNAQTLHFYSHAGTHMDAPFHFEAGDQTIDEIPPKRFIGPAWVVRLGAVEPKKMIGVADLGPIAAQFQPGESLILHTGWSSHLGTELYRDALPRISEQLARWCVEKKVNMLAVEPPSVADVHNLEEVTLIHEILLSHRVIIIEGLCNLEAIQSPRVTLIALPLKIKRGDGAPARVVVVDGGWQITKNHDD